jgi:hypothetical protein
VRPSADALVENVLVLKTMGAPERRLFARRKPRAVGAPETGEVAPEPVPTSRATVVRSSPFAAEAEAAAWLSTVDAEEEVDSAVLVLNRALHAYRVCTADPYVTEVSRERALVVRIGYGSGEAVAESRVAEAVELPRSGRRRPRRSMETPEERFAALLGGREQTLPAEELVLRARADLNGGRLSEAALQARVAIEALLAAEVAAAESGPAGSSLARHREAISDAANAALRGTPPDSAAALEEAIAAMESALRRHRLKGGQDRP